MKIRLKLASLVLLLFVLTNCIKENECCCSQDITYLPTYSNPSNTTSSLIADFTVMKLDKNREPRLKISDDTGVIRYDENLIGKLLQKKPYIDFDYNHDFTIEISFNDYIPVSIKINGWEIINESV